MKLSKYLALGLMSVTLLASCSKEKEQDLTADKQKQVKKQKDNPNAKKEMFKASISAEVQPFELLEYNADENEARASITSKGYAVPSLNITEDELTSGKTKLHWGVIDYMYGAQDETIDSANPSTGSFIVRPESSTKNMINITCPVRSSLNPSTTSWAYFALGGKLINVHIYFDEDNNTSPNARIIGIKNGETQTNRQIPLMTLVQPFDNLLDPISTPEQAPRTTFKPRGCLIGLCFVNKFGEDVTITDITLAKDNALFFEGEFDMRYAEDGNNFYGIPIANPGKKALFRKTNNRALTFPVYANDAATTKGYTLPHVAGTFAAEKDNLPLFHLWGMPKTEGCSDRLLFQVKFKKGGVNFTSRMFTITLPGNNPFQEGKAYRLPIALDNTSIVVGAGAFGSNNHNPLDFVAKYDVRKDGTDFVNSQTPLPPVTTQYYNWCYDNVGFFSLTQAKNLFNTGTPLQTAGFVLPSKEQWQSIVPYHTIRYTQNQPKYRVNDGGAIIGSYTVPSNTMSDFRTKAEGNSFATYALRFKGTPWESAWRYFVDKTKKRLIIKCIDIHGQNKSFNDISNLTFFSNKPNITERIFPLSGYIRTSTNQIWGEGNGLWWSSTPYIGAIHGAWRMKVNSAEIDTGQGYYDALGIFAAVRPFKKTL